MDCALINAAIGFIFHSGRLHNSSKIPRASGCQAGS
ncbi:MAG: hypothetical protein JWR72_3535 [Flavisolibacter sp.]|nr:hypothetical protein [Flavisolibacter sp.]